MEKKQLKEIQPKFYELGKTIINKENQWKDLSEANKGMEAELIKLNDLEKGLEQEYDQKKNLI